MSAEKTESILQIVRKDGRYRPQAYYFIFDALDFTIQRMRKVRHVTGKELLEGIREYATENFGFLARTVLSEWGVTSTRDFGEIVFNLVEAGLLSRTDKDTREDFEGIYDFETAFDREFRRSLEKVTLATTFVRAAGGKGDEERGARPAKSRAGERSRRWRTPTSGRPGSSGDSRTESL